MNEISHIDQETNIKDIHDAIAERIFKAQAITSCLLTSIEISELNDKPFYGVALILEDYLVQLDVLIAKLHGNIYRKHKELKNKDKIFNNRN